MAENAYSCKTNFIILPLPRRFVTSPRFIYFIVRHPFTRAQRISATASLFPVGFVPANIIHKSFSAQNVRRKTRVAFLHAFYPLVSSSVIRERFEIFPYSPFLFSSILYIYIYIRRNIYIFIRDKFHSNLIQRNSILFPFSLEITRYIFTPQLHST